MKAVIVCSGSIEDYSCYDKYFSNAGIVIGVDGGARHLRNFGILPHILLGDFDSILPQDLEFYRENGVELHKYKSEKDASDTEIAVELAIQKGYETIIILGGLGSRFDHSLANIFLLKMIMDNGCKGIIANESNEIYLVRDRIEIHHEKAWKVSIIPVTETVEGISNVGLYYPLKNQTLKMGTSRGVSNEFESETAEISLEKGLLLVIKSKD